MEDMKRVQSDPKWARRWWVWALVVLVLTVGGAVGYAMWRVDHALDKMAAGEQPGPDVDADTIRSPNDERPFTVLVLGVDTRPDLGFFNTDVMMLAVVNPKDRKVSLLSIPRDTRVMIPGYGYAKINAAYAIGENRKVRAERSGKPVTDTGPSLVKKTVSGFFGLPVDHYVLLDFEAFKQMIDALGGIDIDVERRLVYHDPTDGTVIDLYPGLQHLNGEQALGYVRHRHDDRGVQYYSSDFDRNRRQQLVLQKVADKAKSFQGVTRFFTLLDIVSDHVKTDFTKNELKRVVSSFLGVGSEAITTIETHPYWDSIGYTFFPEDDLKRIRETLWRELNLDPNKASALLDPANDQKPVKKASNPAPKPPAKQTAQPSNAKPDPTPTNGSGKANAPVLSPFDDPSTEAPGGAQDGQNGTSGKGEGQANDGAAPSGPPASSPSTDETALPSPPADGTAPLPGDQAPKGDGSGGAPPPSLDTTPGGKGTTSGNGA